MKRFVFFTALFAILGPLVSRAAIVTRGFTGSLNSTTLNFLSLSPAPSVGTPRSFVLSLDFNDTGTLTGSMTIGSTIVDTFGAASGWSVNDSGSNDLLVVTGQSGVNATKFYQFTLGGGNVTAVATNSLSVLNALLATATAPTTLAIGAIGSGALGYAGTVAVVPEPSSLAMLACAAMAWGTQRRRRHST